MIPFDMSLNAQRAYYLVHPRRRQDPANLTAFRGWIRQEMEALDWDKWRIEHTQ